ncbi:MAG: TetR/AcrR family transcriptional regulator [Candidatus Rifleibacteriota bacterium]
MRNPIQQDRIRNFFIDAAVAIVKNDGPEGLSARRIAKEAGYSYATLYNYFQDIDDLVFECICIFSNECQRFVSSECHDLQPGIAAISAVCRAYVRFFLRNPGLFGLLFTRRISDSEQRKRLAAPTTGMFFQLTGEHWRFLIRNGQIDKDAARRIDNQLLVSINGMLLLFLHQGYPRSFSEFVASLDESIEQILFSAQHIPAQAETLKVFSKAV